MELTVNDLRKYGRGKSKSKYVILVYYNNTVKYIARKNFGYERTVILKDAMFFKTESDANDYILCNNLNDKYNKTEIKRAEVISEYRLID